MEFHGCELDTLFVWGVELQSEMTNFGEVILKVLALQFVTASFKLS